MAELMVTAGIAATTAAATGMLVNTAISVGLGLVQRALTPDQIIKQQGPRLTESQITGSAEGSPVSRITGTVRLGGQMIWATSFRETVVETTESRGGKGGPKAVTQTTEYIYDSSFAIGLCEANGDVEISRVWLDGKETDLSTVTYRFYDGSQVVADSKIEATEGAGTVPAFTGTAYIVFENLELTDYGNRIPTVTVELTRSLTKLSEIITELTERIGYDDGKVDVSEIAAAETTVSGMLVGSVTSPASVLQNLMVTFLFDCVEEGQTLRFFYRANSASATVHVDDMILGEQDRDAYTRSRAQDEELPNRTQVDFLDAARDYDAASVDGHIVVGRSRRVSSVSLLSIVSDAYARALADVLTHEAWVARDSIQFSVPFGSPITLSEYLRLRPGVTFEIEGWRYRVMRRTVGDEIQIEAVGFDDGLYQLVSHASESGLVTGTPKYTASTLIAAELPLLSTSSPAPWSPRLIAYQDPFPAAVSVFQEDGSGGYDINTNVPVAGVSGTTTTDLNAGPAWRWDTANSVTVNLVDDDATLLSASDDSVLAGANTMAILTPGGQWEVFQFANAVLNGDGTYTLSRLLRGQLGTEPYIADPAPSGSTVVLYDPGRWGTLSGTSNIIGQDQLLRYGPSAVLVSDDRYQDVTITPEGVAYRPYAPTGLKHERDPVTGDITLSWVRRSRFDGDSWQIETVPLNEDFERYSLIITGGRTVQVDDTTSYVYTAAQQTTDFGSAQASVAFTVQQVSAVYGAGSIAGYTP